MILRHLRCGGRCGAAIGAMSRMIHDCIQLLYTLARLVTLEEDNLSPVACSADLIDCTKDVPAGREWGHTCLRVGPLAQFVELQLLEVHIRHLLLSTRCFDEARRHLPWPSAFYSHQLVFSLQVSPKSTLPVRNYFPFVRCCACGGRSNA